MDHVKRAVVAPGAPQALGPYSAAVTMGPFVFASGQTGIRPATGELADGGIEGQTRQVLANMAAVLEAAGSSFADVLKTTVFLTDMADFPVMNAIYAEYFPEPFPARSTVQVAALPKGGVVEIEAIARVCGS
ncbi:MAG TPA: Rid family detoxifying hydrolase [Coriobacteriia bacterium]